MQQKTEGTQVKHAERVDWPQQITSCALFLKKHNVDKVDAKETRVNRFIKRKYLYCGVFIYADDGFYQNTVLLVTCVTGQIVSRSVPLVDFRTWQKSAANVLPWPRYVTSIIVFWNGPTVDFRLWRKSAVNGLPCSPGINNNVNR